MKFNGTGDLSIPDGVQLDVEYYSDAVLIHYVLSDGSVAYLDWVLGGSSWEGTLGLSDGSVEFASGDGTFSDFKAIGANDLPINPSDYDPASNETADATSAPPEFDFNFGASLMSLGTDDHLGLVLA